MPQYRVYYAVYQVCIAPDGTAPTTSHVAHGLQNCGITTTFNLEQVFEIGQQAIYENIENIPDIEITLEKVLDKYPLLYHMATRGASAATLGGRSNQKCGVAISVFPDTFDSASGAAGTVLAEAFASGMFVSSLTYNFPVEGNFSEQVSLIGNNIVWKTSGITLAGAFNNTDAPLSASASGGVNRREDFIWRMDTTSGNASIGSRLPTQVDGINASGNNVVQSDGFYPVAVQNITVSTNLGREPLFQLGKKGPYFRFVQFPTEVTCEISIISKRGSMVGATEEGTQGDGNNLINETIVIKAREGTKLDLGSRNKLASISETGGDAGTGGGNRTITYSYSNFNDLTVTHPTDPTTALAADS
jgi:hypothetical protein